MLRQATLMPQRRSCALRDDLSMAVYSTKRRDSNAASGHVTAAHAAVTKPALRPLPLIPLISP
eukprot:364988-Chlamydomonas_euryale.AAC.22